MASSSSLAGAAARRVGTLLCDKWRIGPVLGIGGMSVVYRAVHRNGKQVAIKVLHPELTLRSRTRQRFLREGYLANLVAHPGAVSVLDDGVAPDGTVFLVMELLEGETMGSRLQRTHAAFALGHVLAIADGLLNVLAAAHDKGIVHRDVKPDNVFVTLERELKLLDFGIASLRDLSALGAGLTGSGLAPGTPGFMAPEQARGSGAEIDHRTDLWAVGATMFTLLTNRPVHEGQNGNEALILAATRPARSLRELAPGIDSRIADIVDRALAFDKAERWPEARAMQAALRAASDRGCLPLPVPDGVAPCAEVETASSEATWEATGGPPAEVRAYGAGDRSGQNSKLLWTAAAALSLVGCAIAFEVGIGANSTNPRLSSALRNVVSSATPSLPRATLTKSTATETAPARPTTDSHAERRPARIGRPKPAPVVPAPAAVTTDSKASASSGADTHPRPAIDPARLMSDDVLDRRD